MAHIAIAIPAFNAAATLAETLASVLAQQFDDWEAVVIDDGSTDATSQIAQQVAARDPRVRLVAQANGGLAAARNRALLESRAPFVQFLDADDTIAPDHLARLAPLAGPNTVAYSGYRRVTADGRLLDPVFDPGIAHAPFEAFARTNKLAVHCALAPRALLERAGPFDPSLPACEDWDMWARIARTGAAFVASEPATAFYHMSAGSMSRQFDVLAEAGEIVLARCYARDTRVADPAPALSGGIADGFEAARLHFRLWCSVAAIAAGAARTTELPPADMSGEAEALADNLIDALAVGGQCTRDVLADAWARLHPAIVPLVEAIGERSSEAGLAHRVIYSLERTLVRASRLDAAVTLSLWCARRSNADSITPIAAGTEVAHLRFAGSDEAARVELPMYGQLTAAEQTNALAAQGLAPAAALAGPRGPWQGARDRLRRWTRGRAPPERSGAIIAAAAEAAQSLPVVAQPQVKVANFPAGEYTREYWDAFFECANPWQLDHAYEQRKYEQTLSLVDGIAAGRVLEVGCAEGHFTRQLAPKVGSLLAIDIAATAVERARTHCAELANIEFACRDVMTEPVGGDFDLTICSEMLYFFETEARLAQTAAILRDTLAPGGRLLMMHSRTITDDPTRTGFDWGMLGAETIARTFAHVGGLRLERSLQSELYRIDLWRGDDADAADPPRIEAVETGTPRLDIYRKIRWGGIVHRAEDLCAVQSTRAVPVLMYHMVAAECPPGLARWCVAPDVFEAQLRLLRRHGFYSITSGEFDWYRVRGEPLPGRPVMLTFDDATADFAATAWPLLARNDFRAEVFVPTDKVGKTADWYRHLAPPQPLMDWEAIAGLHARGIAFGSHLASHTHVDGLSSEALLGEAAGSRAVLERRLGIANCALAVPFGGLDERAIRIFDRAGYSLCFSTRPGTATIDQHSLNLPRIEVHGDMSLNEFAAAVGIV